MHKFFIVTAVLSATTVLYAPSKAVAAADSVYSYSESTANDYNFVLPETDDSGNITGKYYRLNLESGKFTTAPAFGWQELTTEPLDKTDVLSVKLPNNETRFYKYTYTAEPGAQVFNTQQNNLSGNIDAEFYNSRSEANGGAVSNGLNIAIGNIKGNFVSNHSDYGGAIHNQGTMGLITGDFVGNNTQSHYPNPMPSDGASSSYGGAIFNLAQYSNAKIEGINGNFVGNYINNPTNLSFGGAIYNSSVSPYLAEIGDINGNFIGNHVLSDRDIHGGAIYNSDAVIGNINGDFIGNYTVANDTHSQGGAIYNNPMRTGKSVIGDISGNFIGNYSHSIGDYSLGGSIANFGTIGKITGDFINNHAETQHLNSQGGAVYNAGSIDSITGNFIGNYTIGNSDSISTSGGAITSAGNIGNIEGSFFNNYAKIEDSGDSTARGGAVMTSKETTFTTGGQTRYFSGNYTQDNRRGKIYNAIFVRNYSKTNPSLVTFDTSSGGAWIINDNIEGGWGLSQSNVNYNYHYDLLFKGSETVNPETGTTSGYTAVNNDIVNANLVTVDGTTLRFGTYRQEDKNARNWDGKGAFIASLNTDGTANRDADAVTSLTLHNGAFHIANGYTETIRLKNLSSDNGFVHIDVNPDTMTSDVLNINGDVEGVTNLIVHATSDTDIRNRGGIVFAQSTNDTAGHSGSFVVSRVYTSPYLYNIAFDRMRAGDPQSHTWEFWMSDAVNPDPVAPIDPAAPDTPEVVPEVPAYQGLPAASLEQTRSMVDNIARQITKVNADYNLWGNIAYYSSKFDAPLHMDTDIWGIEAGKDLLHDIRNKLGIFISYRDGKYDFDGRGKHYYSPTGSKIDIDSYIAGLYYRFDKNDWWAFATLYGGMQKAHIKTDDGIKSDTDGTQFGGSIEAGYDYALNNGVYLTPSLGAYYTQINFDAAHDNAGKRVKYGDLNRVELEAGLKLSKLFSRGSNPQDIYIKPSLIQSIVNGDSVRITGLDKVHTVDDQTLGRIEVGGRYNFTAQLSGYGWANYTYGSDYDSATVGLGLNYAW